MGSSLGRLPRVGDVTNEGMRTWLTLSAAVLLAGCPSDDTSPTSTSGSDDSDASTGGETVDPTAATTLSTTGSTTADPTTGGSSSTSETPADTSSSGEGGSSDTSTTAPTSTGESSSSTGSPCEFLACGDACVDPATDPDFCGATECEGENAGVVCSGSATCEAGECVETCDNCSFEAGDFTGWTVIDLLEPFTPAAVYADGDDPGDGFFGIVTATDGLSVAVNGFDGTGATSMVPISFGQDITIRQGATTLEFDYRLAWDLTFGATLDRTFEVRIEPEGGGKPLETILLETAVASTADDVITSGSIDVSAYADQTVFINFVWTVPEDFVGPGRAELDNIRVLAE